jgi:oxygen-independent coproporphyrinogen-3 oxidase
MEACINATKKELNLLHEWGYRKPLETLFIGGGTPTHLPSKLLSKLLDEIHNSFSLSNLIEFTVEANPESLSLEKLEILWDAGVNRISLGVQSIHKRDLTFLDRPHNLEQAEAAIDIAKQLGFHNFNLDLIHSIPGLSIEDWERTLYWAIEKKPNHISCYGLTVEQKTPLFRRKARNQFQEQSDEVQLAFMNCTRRVLRENGFSAYEISNFAKPNSECRHNLNYWRGGDYFGVGPGASKHFRGTRKKNISELYQYIKALANSDSAESWAETLSPESRCKEALWLGMRLKKGANLKAIHLDTGVNPHPIIEKKMDAYMSNQFCLIEGGRLTLSEKGLPLADFIAAQLLT